MFAVVDIDGRQYKVTPKETISVHKLDAEPNKTLSFPHVVLLSKSDKEAVIGQPYVNGASVEAKVVEHFRGEKVQIFKFNAKKRFQKAQGHRQDLTKIEILDIKG